MNTAAFLAQFWGLSFVILGVLFLMRREVILGYMKSVVSEPGIILIAGYASLSIGLGSILVHNVWSLDWRGIVTLIGWLSLVKWVVVIGFPRTTKGVINFYKNDKLLSVALFGIIIIGIYLVIRGFGL